MFTSSYLCIIIYLKKMKINKNINKGEMKMNNLNKNELNVLKSLIRSSKGNGHDFGFTDEYEQCGFTKHQMAGYISSLSKKGYIDLDDLSDDHGTICNAVMFIFTLKAEEILENVYVDSNH